MRNTTMTLPGMDILYNEGTIYTASGSPPGHDVRRKADIASPRCRAGCMSPYGEVLKRGI